MKNNVVRINYQELVSKTSSLTSIIKSAFGLNGLGFALIENIPKYPQLRLKVLESGYALTMSPKEVLEPLMKPDISYSTGWDVSEFITETDKKQIMFNSFTARCLRDTLVYPKNPELEKSHRNVWPALYGFNDNYVNLGKLISTCQLNLLRHISEYTGNTLKDFNNKLYNDFENDHDAYCRLIAYNPPEDFNVEDKYTWDGWHTDYSLLTALTHPIYLTRRGELFKSNCSSLMVKDRNGIPHEVHFKENELLIQASDSLFILTAGNILPTAHSVKINKSMPLNLYRINFATFLQPNYNYIMNIPGQLTYDEIIDKDPLKLPYKTCHFENGWEFAKFYESSLDYLLSRKN